MTSSSSSVKFNGSLHPKLLHYCHLLAVNLPSLLNPQILLMRPVFLKKRKTTPFPSPWLNLLTTCSNVSSVPPLISPHINLLWLAYFLQLRSTCSTVSIALHPSHNPVRCYSILKRVPFKKQWPVRILLIITSCLFNPLLLLDSIVFCTLYKCLPIVSLSHAICQKFLLSVQTILFSSDFDSGMCCRNV